VDTPLLYSTPDSMKEDLRYIINQNISKKVEDIKKTFKPPSVAIQCDICSNMAKEGNRFKAADKEDYDLCEECFVNKELDFKDESEEYPRRHPYWVVKGFQNYEFARL